MPEALLDDASISTFVEQQQPEPVGAPAEEPKQQQASEDADKWICEVCTFENTMTDWSELTQSDCEVCEQTNEAVKAVIISQ